MLPYDTSTSFAGPTRLVNHRVRTTFTGDDIHEQFNRGTCTTFPADIATSVSKAHGRTPYATSANQQTGRINNRTC
jgi:hypothetical protein